MARKSSQGDDALPAGAGSPDAARAGGDEADLLDVLAGQAVEELLTEQTAAGEGAEPGVDERLAVEPTAGTDAAETEPAASQPADSTPAQRSVTPEELDAMFGPPADQIDGGPFRPTRPSATAEPAPVENGPTSQDDMDALVEQVAAETDEGAPAEPAATAEPAPVENGQVGQADLNAVCETAAEQTDPGPAEAGSPEPPEENGAQADADEALGPDGLDALFGAASGQARADGDATGEPAEDEDEAEDGTADETLSSAELDELLSQAAEDGGMLDADEDEDLDDVEAALDRQQAEHPDPVRTASAAVSPAEAVSGGEADALRVESAATNTAAPPVMSMDELDDLLAQRAEDGAAAADIASDSLELQADPQAEAEDQEAVAAASGEAESPAAAAAAAEGAAAKPPSSPVSVLVSEEGEPSQVEPATEFSAGRRPLMRLIDRINEPFVDLRPAVREILGYIAVALLGLSVMLAAMALRG